VYFLRGEFHKGKHRVDITKKEINNYETKPKEMGFRASISSHVHSHLSLDRRLHLRSGIVRGGCPKI
jgi:hypothetical protein